MRVKSTFTSAFSAMKVGLSVSNKIKKDIQTALLMFLGMAFSVRTLRLRMVCGRVELLVQFYFIYT